MDENSSQAASSPPSCNRWIKLCLVSGGMVRRVFREVPFSRHVNTHMMAIIPFRKSYQIARLRISSGDLGIAAQSVRARRCSATGVDRTPAAHLGCIEVEHSIEAHRKNRGYRSPAEPTLGSEIRFFWSILTVPAFQNAGQSVRIHLIHCETS
jgi:hypothetical protein